MRNLQRRGELDYRVIWRAPENNLGQLDYSIIFHVHVEKPESLDSRAGLPSVFFVVVLRAIALSLSAWLFLLPFTSTFVTHWLSIVEISESLCSI